MSKFAKLNREGTEVVDPERNYAVDPGSIKLCLDGNPQVRPLIDIKPTPAAWQTVKRTGYTIQPTTVTVVYTLEDKPVGPLRKKRKDEVYEMLSDKLNTGFQFQPGKFVQLRPSDQGNITAAALKALMVVQGIGTWPEDFAWRVADDTFMLISDAQTMIAMADAAMGYVFVLRQVSWDHKDALAALQTAQEVMQYDITTDW